MSHLLRPEANSAVAHAARAAALDATDEKQAALARATDHHVLLAGDADAASAGLIPQART